MVYPIKGFRGINKTQTIVELCLLYKSKISFRAKIHMSVPCLGLKPN